MNGNSLIKTEGLCKYYKNGKIKALDGVDMEIERGEVVVIIGPLRLRQVHIFKEFKSP